MGLEESDVWKAPAHPGRIKMLEAMRAGERAVAERQALLDDEPASAAQHLAILRHKNVVVGRKDGTTVYYSVREPMIFDLLRRPRHLQQAPVGYTRDPHNAM